MGSTGAPSSAGLFTMSNNSYKDADPTYPPQFDSALSAWLVRCLVRAIARGENWAAVRGVRFPSQTRTLDAEGWYGV